jgi:hypothetical protein
MVPVTAFLASSSEERSREISYALRCFARTTAKKKREMILWIEQVQTKEDQRYSIAFRFAVVLCLASLLFRALQANRYFHLIF